MSLRMASVINDSEQSALTAEEKIASLFQPDMLLSAQYFENLRRRTHFEPEKRLMLALLEDAINCYQDNLISRSGKKKRLFEDTEQWVLRTDGDWIFSFDNVCDALGFWCCAGAAATPGQCWISFEEARLCETVPRTYSGLR